MTDFWEKYDHSSLETDVMFPNQPINDDRSIPGGRYGCAQFVKACGPKELRDCSFGRLSQMVQKAIKDDILRY